MICDDCKKERDDVRDTFCPYADEIAGEKIAMKLCNDCYQERSMDI